MAGTSEQGAMSEDVRPEFTGKGLPMCVESCPSHDGKRCRALGFRPSSICEPAVEAMAVRIRALVYVGHGATSVPA